MKKPIMYANAGDPVGKVRTSSCQHCLNKSVLLAEAAEQIMRLKVVADAAKEFFAHAPYGIMEWTKEETNYERLERATRALDSEDK